MKNLIVILSFILSVNLVKGQIYCTYAGGACASNLASASSYAQNVVQHICQVIGMPYISTYRSDTGNACASTYYGSPIIAYNADFMNHLRSYNQWAPISVLAHEVGHHINRDVSWYGQFKHPWTKGTSGRFFLVMSFYKMGPH
ncbi:MAG: hypothetical protein R3B93_08925 [Bacteroidia bacterium]